MHLSCGKFVGCSNGSKSIANSFTRQHNNNNNNNNSINNNVIGGNNLDSLIQQASAKRLSGDTNNSSTNDFPPSLLSISSSTSSSSFSSKNKKCDISKYFSQHHNGTVAEQQTLLASNSTSTATKTKTCSKVGDSNVTTNKVLNSFFAKSRPASGTATRAPRNEYSPLPGVNDTIRVPPNPTESLKTKESHFSSDRMFSSTTPPGRNDIPNDRPSKSGNSNNSTSTIDKLLSKQKSRSIHNRHGNNNSLMTTAITTTSSSIEDLMICDRCGKRLLAWDLPDHMDFHFAKDLQDSLQENFFTMCNPGNGNKNGSSSSSDKKRSNVSPPKKPGKKLRTDGGSDSLNGNNRLSRYFSPVKKKRNEP